MLALCFVVGACPGPAGSVTPEGPKAVRPAWVPSPNQVHPDFVYVTGACRDQGSMERGRACALKDAARQLQARLGLTTAVQVEGSYIKDDYSELRRVGMGRVRDCWILVAYPRRAVARVQTRIANRVLLGVRCTADPPTACSASYRDRVEAFLTRAGFGLAPQPLPADLVGQGTEALKIAETQQAAKLALVTMEGRFTSALQGEFYAEAHCTLRLLDAVNGKLLQTFQTGPVKGGHIAKESAVKKAFDSCLKILAEKSYREF